MPKQVLVASTGVIGVNLQDGQGRAGHPQRRRRTGARQGQRDGARHHDDRSVPEGGRRHASQTSRGTFTVGGTAKGSGMIEPNMATMLGFLTTDARCRRRCSDRALRGIGARHVQRDHRRRRVLDQRLAVRAGVRRQRRRDRRGRSIRPCSMRLLAVSQRAGAGHRPRRRGRHQGDQRSRPRCAQHRRCPAGGAHDRELAAGQDRGSRRRPELGTHRRRGWPRRRAVRRQPATVHVGGVLLFENGLPHDDAAPRAAEHLKGRDISIEVSLGTERAWRRPPSGPAISVPNTCASTASTERDGQLSRRRGSPKDFLSILDLVVRRSRANCCASRRR